MTYNVFSGTLNPAQSQSQLAGCWMAGWWRSALLSPDGMAPSRMVGVSASVNLPLHHKVQKFLFWGTGSPRVVLEKGP